MNTTMYPPQATSMGAVAPNNYASVASGGIGLSPVNPPKQPPLHSSLDALEHNIARLHDVISTLQHRLSCVLEYDEPKAATETAGATKALTRPVDRVQSLALSVEYATAGLEHLLRRLEL